MTLKVKFPIMKILHLYYIAFIQNFNNTRFETKSKCNANLLHYMYIYKYVYQNQFINECVKKDLDKTL